KKYSEKRVRAYAFRQFQRTIEKERKEQEIKSGKQKEIIVSGYGKIKEQTITYKTRKYSTVIYRDSKGRFTKNPAKKIMEKEEPQKRIFGELPYCRASVFIEVPFHSNASRGINNYYWFGIIVIDKKENIDIAQIHEELIRMIEKELHYNRHSLDWFDWEHPAIEYPKPYPSNRPDKFFEKWSKTHK
ncbi:MAG: hypothetical protein WAW96_11310, partial [Alphaproteobacteria bacterium]